MVIVIVVIIVIVIVVIMMYFLFNEGEHGEESVILFEIVLFL